MIVNLLGPGRSPRSTRLIFIINIFSHRSTIFVGPGRSLHALPALHGRQHHAEVPPLEDELGYLRVGLAFGVPFGLISVIIFTTVAVLRRVERKASEDVKKRLAVNAFSMSASAPPARRKSLGSRAMSTFGGMKLGGSRRASKAGALGATNAPAGEARANLGSRYSRAVHSVIDTAAAEAQLAAQSAMRAGRLARRQARRAVLQMCCLEQSRVVGRGISAATEHTLSLDGALN
eukprot:CAMPEP_0179918568 /NCGR_PEP_ID=MMETSP0983-20121128/3458_1 /TAXON_ID=483367 /ORGANISM="non described non described, Strain CCMP 2436" /LENGTH=232 /DNA_ID=CAMNT_0021821423 /DNA_START=170 /DNA_END=871 /DNA_ORIENTATION=-